jgi:hypothetical protein
VRRHQEEMARDSAEELAELVGPCLVHLVAVEVRLVGLVDDDEIPVGPLELRLKIPRQRTPMARVRARGIPVPLLATSTGAIRAHSWCTAKRALKPNLLTLPVRLGRRLGTARGTTPRAN